MTEQETIPTATASAWRPHGARMDDGRSRYLDLMGAPNSNSAEAKLARRDAILAAVTRSSELLSGSQPWATVLPEVLACLGEATRVSRVYVFETTTHEGVECVSQRFEWCAPGVPPQIDNPGLQLVPVEEAGFGRWGQVLRAGEPLFGEVHDFPESEQPLLEVQEIKSLLVQPIFEGARWYGFMGFDACESVQSWERIEVDTLRIATLALGAAMHRQLRDAQMRETQKLEALGRMASSVAHDFNNVLMVIAGGMELLKNDLELAGMWGLARGRQAGMIDQALERASSLTRRLLEFSRRQTAAPKVVLPMELLQQEEPLLRQALGVRARLRIAHGPSRREHLPIRIDPTEFAQIALNLVVNARDAMPSGGELLIEVSTLAASEQPAEADGLADGVWTLVRVVDSGQGMPPEVLAHAFEPFFTTKPREKGTGLGLPTVQGIVQGAGGTIRVSSEIGRGTEFRIYLPAVQASPAKPSGA
jgi:signal transduction histidine kinase